MSAAPTLDLEHRLLGERPLIIALDEVGRGALAGPVAVGGAVMNAETAAVPVPDGLRDSKLITEKRRPDVAARAAAWVPVSTVGWASSAEVDEVGIIRALGLAALRAIEQIAGAGFDPRDAVVLLDGNHDYITTTARGSDEWASAAGLDVRTVVKGDRDCASISAASVAAKVARDALMVDLDAGYPDYAWARNKGYASAAHREAIARLGLTDHHRRSWAIAEVPTLF